MRGMAPGMTETRASGHVDAAVAGADRQAWLVYDGDCPFCRRYVQYVRVRQSVSLRLVNARDGGALVDEVRRAGLDLDGGMVLKMGDRYYHGADCIHVLALLGSPSDAFNRVNAAIFRSERLSRLLYPVLRAGRNATLRLLGRSKVGAAEAD